MGLFDAFVGPKHPELAADHPAAATVASLGDGFASFVASANDRMEAVVGDGSTAYVFVGKPPKAFGLVWFEDGVRSDVRAEMEAHRMTRETASILVSGLGDVYTRHSAAERFAHKVAGHAVTITPSVEFHTDIANAIARARA